MCTEVRRRQLREPLPHISKLQAGRISPRKVAALGGTLKARSKFQSYETEPLSFESLFISACPANSRVLCKLVEKQHFDAQLMGRSTTGLKK